MIAAITAFFARSKAALYGALALAGVVLVAWLRAESARSALDRRAAEEAAERERSRQEGLNAQVDERRAGGDVDAVLERMRERDGDWR